MKKSLLVIVILFFGIYMFGCAKKESGMEESQVPMSIETISTINAASPAVTPETSVPAPKGQAVQASAGAPAQLEPLPPAGPYKPTGKDIQSALKNAGFYAGEVDGKIGPKTKAAIEAFQKANNLKPDGKVGPKTWV
ncbi:MAG TPA: peptidoglycan-binding domain-containing protein, partial [Candidatus Margulisiibacteriota bacterium]|nr:peptidoglycan-binding domain-containing protein [Candidatus Margulisiibacteriota bacterium]